MGYVHTVTSANLGTFSFGWIQLENKCWWNGPISGYANQ
jgi:hypothetical protein